MFTPGRAARIRASFYCDAMTDLEQTAGQLSEAEVAGRKLGLCMLIALFTLLIVVTGRQGISDFHTLRAVQEMDRGAGTLKLQDPATVARTQHHLETALELAPTNAWSLQMMTSWKLRTSLLPADAPRMETEVRAALASVRASLRQRPTYPQAWAQLASLKMRLGERDEELWTALTQADKLGPWETDVLMTIMAVSLPLWSLADEAMQTRLQGSMERAARRNMERATFLATVLRRLDVFCALSYVKVSNVKACMPDSKK